MDETVVALGVFFFMFGLPTIGFVVSRAMQHRERLEMIRSGIVPPGPATWKQWQAAAPTPAPAPQRFVPAADDDAQRTLKKGVVLSFVGMALTIGLSFIGFLVDPPHFVLGPWLLGGLIPMFVGFAQVATAVLFGATFPASHATRFGASAAQGAPSPPPPPPTFEGGYTYRPDPNTQELGQASPPDRR